MIIHGELSRPWFAHFQETLKTIQNVSIYDVILQQWPITYDVIEL